jgi:uncharacterized membrane protein HdeD (DUF308 family)
MTDTAVSATSRSLRTLLAVSGIVSVIFGIAVMAWPSKTAVVITGVIAVYAIVAGIVYACVGIFSKNLGTGGRVGHVILGLLYVIGGIFAFSELQRTSAFLAIFVTVMIGMLWIFEGIVSLFSLGQTTSSAFTVLYAILSIIAGFTLVSSPVWGAVFLWWFLGIALIVLGVVNFFRAILGSKA